MKKFAPAIRRLTALGLIGCAGATIASFLGRFSWFCDLFSHFHLQYGVVLLGLAISFAVLQSWRLLAATAVVLLPNVFLASYYLPVASPSAIPAAIRVTSHNLLSSNPRHAEVLNYLRRSDSDLLLLLEVNDAWARSLEPLTNTHPHRIVVPRGDNFGIALYSRFPITARHIGSLPPGVPVLSVTVATHQGPLTIIGTHPIPPMGADHSRDRDTYLAAAATTARDTGTTTILLGDLNTTPWSHAFRDLINTSGLRDSGKHRGFQSTWHRRHPLKSIPIDHVLHTPDLQVFERHIGPALGSDHHPVHVTFGKRG